MPKTWLAGGGNALRCVSRAHGDGAFFPRCGPFGADHKEASNPRSQTAAFALFGSGKRAWAPTVLEISFASAKSFFVGLTDSPFDPLFTFSGDLDVTVQLWSFP